MYAYTLLTLLILPLFQGLVLKYKTVDPGGDVKHVDISLCPTEPTTTTTLPSWCHQAATLLVTAAPCWSHLLEEWRHDASLERPSTYQQQPPSESKDASFSRETVCFAHTPIKRHTTLVQMKIEFTEREGERERARETGRERRMHTQIAN